MCDPTGGILTTALLLGGSAGMNYLGNKAVDRKSASVQGWENNRQAAWQQQAGQLVEGQASKFAGDKFSGDLTAKRDQLANAFKEAISSNTSFLPATGVLQAPKIVSDDANARIAESTADSTAQGNARATLESLGSLMNDRNIDLSRNGNEVRTIGNFMQGSANVLPLEMQAAQGAGRNHRLIADILQAAGTATMGGALKAPAATSIKSMPSVAAPGFGANARTFYLPPVR